MVRPTAERRSSNSRRSRSLVSPAMQTSPRAKAVGGLQTRRQLRGAGEVAVLGAAGAGGRLAEDELFGGAPGQKRNQIFLEVRSGERPHLAEVAFGKTAAAADRQCLGFGNAKSEQGNGMAGLMIGDTAAHIGRPFGLAAAHGIEQICSLSARPAVRATRRAWRTQRSTSAPVCPRAASAAARRSAPSRSAPRWVRKMPISAGTSGSGMCDMTVEAAGAHQRRIEPSGIVTGGDNDNALAPFETIQAFEQRICDGRPPIVIPLSASARRDSVDLVDEQDAGTVLPGPRRRRCGSPASHGRDDPLAMTLPLGIAGGDKVHIGFARDCSRKGGLTGPWRSS